MVRSGISVGSRVKDAEAMRLVAAMSSAPALLPQLDGTSTSYTSHSPPIQPTS